MLESHRNGGFPLLALDPSLVPGQAQHTGLHHMREGPGAWGLGPELSPEALAKFLVQEPR